MPVFGSLDTKAPCAYSVALGSRNWITRAAFGVKAKSQ